MKPPLKFADHPELPERIPEEEAHVTQSLLEELQNILETTSRNYGHAVRSVHAKSHGLIATDLEVLGNLQPELAQGLFAQPGHYQAVLRISTNPGDLLPDSISVPRGAALKVIGVPGERLPGAEGTSQDFVMVNGPAFPAPNPAAFLRSLRLLAKTTDRATWAKVALSSVLRGAEKVLEAVVGESATLQSLGGARNVHPLGETYFSQTAFRHGDYIAKFQLAPVSESFTRLAEVEIDAGDDPDAIRKEVDKGAEAGGEWELRAQLCRDGTKMPVEDASVVWDEGDSPFQVVARLHAAPQPGWSEARAAVVDETMRFSVWTGLAAHQPVGAINRVRQQTYDMSARFRASFNRCPIHEPHSIDLPGGRGR